MKLKWIDWNYGLIFFIPLFLGFALVEFGILTGDLINIYFLAALLPIIYLKVYFPFKRNHDLKKFAKLEKYKFFKHPMPEQLDEFRNFKSLLRIGNKNLQFKNLLAPNDKTYSKKRPTIVLNVEEYTRSTSYGSIYDTYTDYIYTQLFLFKTDHKLPVFYLEGSKDYKPLFAEKLNFLSEKDKIELNMTRYKEKELLHNNLPLHKYKLHSPENNILDSIDANFIELLNGGLKKGVTIHIESDGENIIFYIFRIRHSIAHMKFYSEIFSSMLESLTTK